jgi:Xaa-Pro dipeptidase
VSASGEYAARLAKARAILAAHDCPVMLVDHGELLAWLTGYTVSETMYRAALIPREGEPCFVLRALDAGPCRAGVWFENVIGYPDDADPHLAVATALRARGFAAARIGVDFTSYGFTSATRSRLQALLPEAAFVDLGPVSDTLRTVKSEVEIGLLSEAATIADETMSALAKAVAPGMLVREAAAVAAAEMLRRGADDGGPGPILRAAGDDQFLHGQGLDERLVPGDVLHVELTPRVKGYSARLMRPILLGRDAERERIAMQLIALQDEQLAAMRPGVPARTVDAVLRQRVLGEGLRADYRNVTGYTLGIYARTPRPSDFSYCFHPAAEWQLEAGMVFHMYVSATGLAFSESVLVSGSGVRRLTRHPRAPIIV